VGNNVISENRGVVIVDIDHCLSSFDLHSLSFFHCVADRVCMSMSVCRLFIFHENLIIIVVTNYVRFK